MRVISKKLETAISFVDSVSFSAEIMMIGAGHAVNGENAERFKREVDQFKLDVRGLMMDILNRLDIESDL